MARTVSKLVKQKSVYDKATAVNHENFPAFEKPGKEQYLQMLLTNTLNNTFYVDANTLLVEAIGLHTALATVDPDFTAKALVYARNEGFMRLQPIMGLVALAKSGGHGLWLAKTIFDRVILTPNDLIDFVEIIRGGVISKGMGRGIKTTINRWLNKMSEYHALKYSGDRPGKMSLRDVLRLARPVPQNIGQKNIFAWIVDKNKWWELPSAIKDSQLLAFEAMKKASDDAERLIFIEKGKLPHEVVTGALKPSVDVWQHLMKQMPYLALLRHLNTLARAKVFDNEADVAYVVKRLTDEEALHKAKVFPFQVYNAYKQFAGEMHQNAISRALEDVLEKSVANMPEISGQVCLAPDVSGSMSGLISDRGTTRYIDIAGIFTACLLKQNKNAFVLPFEYRVVNVNVSANDSIMTTTRRLADVGGGGTALCAPIEYLIEHGIKVDVFIAITDSMEWIGSGFEHRWKQYKKNVAPKAKAFLVRIDPYRTNPTPPDEPDVYYIYGWNDTVLKFITTQLTDNIGQQQAVEAVEI